MTPVKKTPDKLYANLIKFPLITEKTSTDSSVVFIVDKKANKLDLKNAVEKIFDVKIESLRTANYKGKPKRTQKTIVFKKSYKKAFVKLKEGYKINIVEGL